MKLKSLIHGPRQLHAFPIPPSNGASAFFPWDPQAPHKPSLQSHIPFQLLWHWQPQPPH